MLYEAQDIREDLDMNSLVGMTLQSKTSRLSFQSLIFESSAMAGAPLHAMQTIPIIEMTP
jgi:hypothetical protein